MKLAKISLLIIAAGCLQPAFGQILPGTTTVVLDYLSVDPNSGTTQGFAGNGSFHVYTGLMNFTGSNQLNPPNPADFVGDLDLFCIELSEVVQEPGTAIYTVVLPQFGSASSNLPLGAGIDPFGIGLDRALNLQLLYGQRFTSVGAYETEVNAFSADQKRAFQLAVWELSHDDNFSLSSDEMLPGDYRGFRVTSAPSAGSLTLAQEWIDAVKAARLNNDLSKQMTLVALHNPDKQDQILPSTAGVLIPEPSALAALLGLGAVGAAGLRRRLRRKE